MSWVVPDRVWLEIYIHYDCNANCMHIVVKQTVEYAHILVLTSTYIIKMFCKSSDCPGCVSSCWNTVTFLAAPRTLKVLVLLFDWFVFHRLQLWFLTSIHRKATPLHTQMCSHSSQHALSRAWRLVTWWLIGGDQTEKPTQICFVESCCQLEGPSHWINACDSCQTRKRVYRTVASTSHRPAQASSHQLMCLLRS